MERARRRRPRRRAPRAATSSPPAALSVKVTARIWRGANAPVATWCAIRRVIVVVLPEPAPARMQTGPRTASAARRCSGSGRRGRPPGHPSRASGRKPSRRPRHDSATGGQCSVSSSTASAEALGRRRPSAAASSSRRACRSRRRGRSSSASSPGRARAASIGGRAARMIFGCFVVPTASPSFQSSSCIFSPAREPTNSISISLRGPRARSSGARGRGSSPARPCRGRTPAPCRPSRRPGSRATPPPGSS